MKLKDLHINLEKEINLLEFHPKKEIIVDSFGIDKNIINDISKNKIKETIKLKKKSEIKIKKYISKKSLDIGKNNKFKKINLQRAKALCGQAVFGFCYNFNKNIFSKLFIYFFIFLSLIFIDKLYDRKFNSFSL
ncbi:MAG: hypothetical protein Q9M97_01240 [Candidatus Gracilibacteria bacterium]|nr:hypothetical protein [Candidatus Gracilibacteria bacterium]